MTIYYGIMTDDLVVTVNPLLCDIPDSAYLYEPIFPTLRNSGKVLLSSVTRIDDIELSISFLNLRSIMLSPHFGYAIRPHSFGDDNVFWRIWFVPSLIAVGMITEDVPYTINIWNAFLDRSIDITSITEIDPDGTDFTIPSVPIEVQKSAETNFILTVLLLGPTEQNSSVTFVVNGITFIIPITGIRVISFFYNVDYSKSLTHKLEFQTEVSRTKKYKEQRRPLRDSMMIATSVNIMEEGINAQFFRNSMNFGKGFVFSVPIYFERIYPISTLTGQSTFTTSNDLSELWMLNNKASYIIIIDNENRIRETKKISSVAVNSIILDNVIAETFSLSTVKIYTAILSTVKNLNISQQTDNLLEAKINFEEFTVGG